MNAVLARATPAPIQRDAVQSLHNAVDHLANLCHEEATRAYPRDSVETGVVMTWRTGLDAMCEYVSPSWCAWRGRTLEREIELGWMDGVHPEDVEGLMHAYLAAFAARRSVCVTFRLKHRSGEYRHVRGVGFPRFIGDKFAGYTGMAWDLTKAPA